MCSLLNSRCNTAHPWSKIWQPTAHGIRWPLRRMSRGISGQLPGRRRTRSTQKCTISSSMYSLHRRCFRCIFRLRKKLKVDAQMRSLTAFSTCLSLYLPIGEYDIASSLHLQLFEIMFFLYQFLQERLLAVKCGKKRIAAIHSSSLGLATNISLS